MRYRVRHRTTYRYAEPVSLGYTLARLTPRTFPGQRCRSATIEIEPAPDERSDRVDAFGNHLTWFAIERPHRQLTVAATSDVTVEGEPALPTLASPEPWDEVAAGLAGATGGEAVDARPYVLPSPLVLPDAEVAAFAAPSFPPGRPLVDAVLDWMSRLHREIAYDPGFTTVSTPLHDVLAHRRGVCQDLAHLAIAGLRAHGLAARYVSGYLETDPPPGRERLDGADASHAWFAVHLPGLGWLDLDPTNDQPVGDRHITVAWGRDYADVAPVVGVLYAGGGGQELDVAVDVERIG